MLGQYFSKSRFWKNVLLLMPEVTEKKLPKKSLLQAIPPSDAPTSTIKSSVALHQSTISSTLPTTKTHWTLPVDQGISLATMGSIGTQKDAFQPTTLKEFEAVFPQLVEDLSEHCRGYGLPDNALKWFQEV